MPAINLFQISSLEKVYPEYKPANELKEISVLKNERFSYQLAYIGDTLSCRYDMKIIITSPLSDFISVRSVGSVPSQCPVRGEIDDYYEKTDAGLFPDVLYPVLDNTIEVLGRVWHSLWISVDLNGTVSSGTYPITVTLRNDEFEVSKTIDIEIIDALLPPQDIIFTQWFHGDCIADYYKTEVFSAAHWDMMEKFIKTASHNGINMILTPIFTPPLDTYVGGERTAIQLVDIYKEGERYTFGFDKLRKWIEMCKRNGIIYFEMAHLFTQWGLEFTPNIFAYVDGVQKRIFGWDVASDSPEYVTFLNQFLPALDKVLKEEKINQNTFFHISDEPDSEHLERYNKLKSIVKGIIPDYTIIDALSDYEFYSRGTVDCPIPATDCIHTFIENNVPNLWSYYCGAQTKNVSNRFMAMPSQRNRIIGLQFYKFNIFGFLHWGYNFYNSALSKKHINPFLITDCIETYPSGDAFSVYPGEDGPLESLRLVVFYEALQDLRALKLLERYIGKDEVVKLIENEAGMEISFDSYPHNKDFLINLRKKINKVIKANISMEENI